MQRHLGTQDAREHLPRRGDQGETVIHRPVHGALKIIGMGQVEHYRSRGLRAGILMRSCSGSKSRLA